LSNDDGSWAKSSVEKANTFSKHFSTVFKPYPPNPQIIDDEIFEYLDSPLQLSPPIPPFKPSEVRKTISENLNPKKAPGLDLITGRLLKELPQKGVLLLTFIFNAVLRLEYFPSQWKIAQIIVIPKPGKPLHEASSYRPISLLSIVSKVFEKLLLKRLQPIIDSQNLIPEHQFGFRRQHSTIEQVHRLVNCIRNTLEKKQFCASAFLDVKQAFDKVWHPGLLYKLKQNLPHTFYSLIKSYLASRKFRIKFQDVQTD
jgi:hypothetical protein